MPVGSEPRIQGNIWLPIRKKKAGTARRPRRTVRHQEHGVEPLLDHSVLSPSPQIITKIIRRLQALTIKLIQVQIDTDELKAPESSSRVITPQTVAVFAEAGGDYDEVVPYCLLRAHALFKSQAMLDQSDYDENLCRSVACEVLARYIMRRIPDDRLALVLSKRYSHLEASGDPSPPATVIETALDLHCTIFLSSDESQQCIAALWDGTWIQVYGRDGQIQYMPYDMKGRRSFIDHFDPTRLSVPQYQNNFRIIVWLIFLFIYSRSVQSPTEQWDPEKQFDAWEIVLYGFSIAFFIEEFSRLFKTIHYQTIYTAISFWPIINMLTYSLLVTAFSFRVVGVFESNEPRAERWHLLSFEFLSCVAPLIWMKLITVFDGFTWIGTMQIVVFRMMRESLLFFFLLAVVFAGFAQALWALDAADGYKGPFWDVTNQLLMALFGSPDFETMLHERRYGQPFGAIIFYSWNVIAILILLNVLVALYASSYDGVTDDAIAEYMAFFAGKTIAMIRTPDAFVYPAPCNLIETFLIAPLEPFVSRKFYWRLNRIVMTIVFFVPLTVIALIETLGDVRQTRLYKSLVDTSMNEVGAQDENPSEEPYVSLDGDENGEEPKICRVSFEDLVQRLPDTSTSVEHAIIREIRKLRDELQNFQKTAARVNESADRVEEAASTAQSTARAVSGADAGS